MEPDIEYIEWLKKRLGVSSLTGFAVFQGKLDDELSEALLKHNESNRPEKLRKIKAWAKDMARGEWYVDGDSPIRIGPYGELHDGQNRCLAQIRSGVAIDVVFYIGSSKEGKLVTDTGTPRTFKDHLRILGVRDHQVVAQTVRFMWDLEVEAYPRTGLKYNDIPFASNVVLEHYYESMDKARLTDAVRAASRTRKNMHGLNRTALATLWYKMRPVDPEDVDDFFDKVKTGADLQKGHPVLALRRTLDMSNPKRTGLVGIQYALMVKAWNAYRDGRPITTLSYKSGGSRPEAYPVPH